MNDEVLKLINFRKATMKDIPEILKLDKELFREFLRMDFSEYENLITYCLYTQVVIEKSTNKIIGTLFLNLHENIFNLAYSIDNIFVVKSWQKNGLGSYLLKMAENYCLKDGDEMNKIDKILLDCDLDKIDFYRKNGYRIDEYFNGYDGTERVQMIKNLNKKQNTSSNIVLNI